MPTPTWTHGPPKIILLATDLSSRCDRALDRSAQLARLWGSHLIALHVLEPAADILRSTTEDLPSWRRPPDRLGAVMAQIRRDLLEDLPDVEVRVEEGDPAVRIDEVARTVGAELVVAGVARNELLGRYLLGATVDRLVRRVPVPILVVKSRARSYREILVATDLSDCSRHALDAAAKFFPNTPLTLLHAFEIPFAGLLDRSDLGDRFRAAEKDACNEFVLASTLTPAQQQNLKVLVEHGAPEAMVRAYMRDKGVDLVVVGTHGRSAIFEVLIGSTAKRILESSPGDVLLVRDPRAVRS